MTLPRAIVGFEGIYDFGGINERMSGAYAPFFEGAFGGAADWDAAAPMKFTGSFGERWEVEGRTPLAVLGWSKDDNLVDEPEIDGMAARLKRDGVRAIVFKDLHGEHDEIWEDGAGVARMILEGLDAI